MRVADALLGVQEKAAACQRFRPPTAVAGIMRRDSGQPPAPFVLGPATLEIALEQPDAWPEPYVRPHSAAVFPALADKAPRPREFGHRMNATMPRLL